MFFLFAHVMVRFSIDPFATATVTLMSLCATGWFKYPWFMLGYFSSVIAATLARIAMPGIP